MPSIIAVEVVGAMRTGQASGALGNCSTMSEARASGELSLETMPITGTFCRRA